MLAWSLAAPSACRSLLGAIFVAIGSLALS
uniref:Uncharacterized protein n=1 Tax=Arundo donax TaxID=35708 RepID=A0A0A9A452_ARUDO